MITEPISAGDRAIKRTTSDGFELWFWCEGCGDWHAVNQMWQWNGDLARPTISPSIKVTYHDGRVCHSFIRDGKIEYLGDCFHELRGRTAELVDVSTKKVPWD